MEKLTNARSKCLQHFGLHAIWSWALLYSVLYAKHATFFFLLHIKTLSYTDSSLTSFFLLFLTTNWSLIQSRQFYNKLKWAHIQKIGLWFLRIQVFCLLAYVYHFNTNRTIYAYAKRTAVFNDMIEQYGAKDTQAVDVFSLDLLDEYKDNTYVWYSLWLVSFD